MMYGWNMLYQCIKEFSKPKTDISEFDGVTDDVWYDEINLMDDLQIVNKMRFYKKIEELYDIQIEQSVRNNISTISELRKVISYYSEIC